MDRNGEYNTTVLTTVFSGISLTTGPCAAAYQHRGTLNRDEQLKVEIVTIIFFYDQSLNVCET